MNGTKFLSFALSGVAQKRTQIGTSDDNKILKGTGAQSGLNTIEIVVYSIFYLLVNHIFSIVK